MKSELIGYHNQDFAFSASIQVGLPESGFSLEFVRTGDPIYPVMSFSGQSGFIFDQSGYFVGGYRKDQTINISGNYFFGDVSESNGLISDDNATGRLSYYLNNTLIANNINGPTGFFDTVMFEDYGDLNKISLSIIKATGSPTVIMDSNSVYLLSSESYYLASSD